MKVYENMDNFRKREQIVETTLQMGEYKGTFKQTMSGNCFGLTILTGVDVNDIAEDEILINNNCHLKITENDGGEYWFACILKNDEGDETEIEDEADRLQDYVVKLEIVDCKILE